MDWQRWLDDPEALILPWEGPVALPEEDGTLLVQSTYSWISEGPFSDLTRNTPDLLEFFIGDETGLPMDEPLLGLVDQGFDYTTLFQAVWELRFWAQEDPGRVSLLAEALRNWLRGRPIPVEHRAILQMAKVGSSPDNFYQKFDLLCFLLTWARQQGLTRYSVFAVIGLNKLLEFDPDVQKVRFQQLYELYLLANRWRRFGGSIRLVYEFSRTPEFLRILHKYCPPLEGPLRCNL